MEGCRQQYRDNRRNSKMLCLRIARFRICNKDDQCFQYRVLAWMVGSLLRVMFSLRIWDT